MKSMFLKALAVSVILVMACSCVFAADTDGIVITLQIDNPNMTVNGAASEIDPGRGTVPVIINGRTLVPIRAIIEAMGGSVGWNAEKAEVTLTFKNDVIKLVINSDVAYLNDTQSTLDVAPTIMNERTMLPIRYIAESFKFDVNWDDAQRIITVSEKAEPISDAPIFMEEPEEDYDINSGYEDSYDEFYDDEEEEEEM